LIISDSLNHNSIVCGARQSGAKIKVFRHGDYKNLEKIVRESIAEGQPRTHRRWKKVIILVEGIYSMEGEIVDLPEVVRIKKKYNCYLYVDEAHSIGALGARGRGVCEQTGVNPRDVDILMGTFTKSFGAVGGYIAGNKDLISYLRNSSFGCLYGSTMPVPCAQQIMSVIKVLLGEDGTDIGRQKIKQLHDNANFFREELMKLGFEVIGDKDSPVIILMLYTPGRATGFSRECLARNMAVVVVGAPATPLIEARVRFCVSAAHTKEDLEFALQQLDQVGDLTLSKFRSSLLESVEQILL
jgi:serine palmitoyltransferase